MGYPQCPMPHTHFVTSHPTTRQSVRLSPYISATEAGVFASL
ncbi:hypothetical protein FDUTEX481_07135 [Tolypothrix sp. PCC 7601]|nr:hypothetical protein FDUTEX481_07135 [Tolypothrix sp. PCC 7601]